MYLLSIIKKWYRNLLRIANKRLSKFGIQRNNTKSRNKRSGNLIRTYVDAVSLISTVPSFTSSSNNAMIVGKNTIFSKIITRCGFDFFHTNGHRLNPLLAPLLGDIF